MPNASGAHRWDRGLDFKATYRQLTGHLSRTDIPTRDRVKTSILLIVLRNGCRIGEGKEAYNKFCEKPGKNIYVRVEKRGFKYPKDAAGKRMKGHGTLTKPFYRKIVVPMEVKPGNQYTKSKSNLTLFATTYFGWNPHSERYAFIGHMQSKNVPAQTIAGITGHATLAEIIHYSSVKVAEKTLEEDVL